MTRPAPVPDGYRAVTPWVVTSDTRRLLAFITQAFDAQELGRVEVDGGAIGHAEARIGDSVIMMFDSPFPVAMPGLLRLYVQDADAVVAGAVAAGATVVTRMTELAWGDRVGRVRDPLGNLWWIQERVAEPTPAELARRLQDPKFTQAMLYLQSTLAGGLDPSQPQG
jgi:PhnB protein